MPGLAKGLEAEDPPNFEGELSLEVTLPNESVRHKPLCPSADVLVVAVELVFIWRDHLDLEITALRMSFHEDECLDPAILFDVVDFMLPDVGDGVNVGCSWAWRGLRFAEALPPEKAAKRDTSEEEKENGSLKRQVDPQRLRELGRN